MVSPLVYLNVSQRGGDDRRGLAQYYRYGSERRDDERRSLATAEGTFPHDAGRELWQEVWGATDEGASAE